MCNTGVAPREISADAGYYSAQVIDELNSLGVESFNAPDQTRHGRVLPPAPRGRIPRDLSSRDRVRRKLRTKRGRQRYGLRMQTVEPVFGQIKQARGFRQLFLRGLDKANSEWLLICTGHNLLKLFRSGARPLVRPLTDSIGPLALAVTGGATAMLSWRKRIQPAEIVAGS